jgi:hypothetical protein
MHIYNIQCHLCFRHNTIIGATFRLQAVAADYTDKAGTRPVGTVGISNKTQDFADYAAGTLVMLYATPNAGYEVDTWPVTLGDDPDTSVTTTYPGADTFTLTTEARPCTVTVTFKPASITLETVACLCGRYRQLHDINFHPRLNGVPAGIYLYRDSDAGLSLR